MKDKTAMYKLTYGLFVLSAKEGNKDNGCIVNTAAQVTTEPNRITVAVNKMNYTHDMIKNTGEFNVSMLTEKAPFEIFKHFGFQSGKGVDKTQGIKLERADNGIVYLAEYANAYISCKVVSMTDLGTHTLFLCDVTDGDVLSDDPSVSYAYYQDHIKAKPESKAAAGGEKKKGWVCSVCGYVYEGEELPADFVCPWCKHPASDFVRTE